MGEFYALTCALVWGLAVVLFRRSGETVPPLALNLFRVAVSSVLFVVTLGVSNQPLLRAVPASDYAILAASGVIAIAISDTLFNACLNRVGAGINAIVDTLYAPFIMLFAALMLGERMGGLRLLGMGLIISGVLLTTRAQPPPGTTRRTLVTGILLGAGAMASIAFGIVLAKPVLERTDVLWATTVRQLASLAVLLPAVCLAPARRRYFAVFRPQASWRFSVPGTLLGSYVALLFWIAGMKHTDAGTAAVLNQTSTIHVLVFASLFLGERFTRRKAAAASAEQETSE